MKIGVFSLIPWNFLDQRPQMTARKIAEWGHDVIYIETFAEFDYWDDVSPHPWDRYWERAWRTKKISDRLVAINPLVIPAHRRFDRVFGMNEEFMIENKKRIRKLNLDLAVVNDPQWGRILDDLGIPYIYDHVDDTHHMLHVMKDFFYREQVYCEKNALITLYIQPQIAKRQQGLYVPNGTDEKDLLVLPKATKLWDGALLSCIADWFDLDSLLESKKKILMIGPIHDDSILKRYKTYRSQGGKNVDWIPRVPRKVGLQWLNHARVGLIPFRQDHGVVDYVMPLKIVEYFALGMPCVSYVNKGLIDAFGDHVYSYSPTGWLGYPQLDQAIEEASHDPRSKERMQIANSYTWDHVFSPLQNLLKKMSAQHKRSGRKAWQDLRKQIDDSVSFS